MTSYNHGRNIISNSESSIVECYSNLRSKPLKIIRNVKGKATIIDFLIFEKEYLATIAYNGNCVIYKLFNL